MVYELYKLKEGTINEKLNLTIDEIKWSYTLSGSWKPHYNVIFKEKLIKNYDTWEANNIWIFPNSAKSGFQDYEAAEKIKDADIFYYFINNLDKKIEFTINYKAKDRDGQSYYSVEVDEKILDTIKQEKSKWDQAGFTNKDDWKRGARKLKEKVGQSANETPAKGPVDNINDRWKIMIIDKFPPAVSFAELETRYKAQKDGILNDPVFLSYKNKSDSEKFEMLKSIISMYDDSEMVRCGNSIKDNYSQLYPIYWEYLLCFSKMIDKEAIKNADINNYWSSNFKEFGSELNVENLTKVKAELDILKGLKDQWEKGNAEAKDFVEFGKTITRENLVKVRKSLDQIKKIKDIVQNTGIDPEATDALQQAEALRNRPTQEQLNKAVNDKAAELNDVERLKKAVQEACLELEKHTLSQLERYSDYDAIKDALEGWKKEFKNQTAEQVNQTIKDLRDQVQKLQGDVTTLNNYKKLTELGISKERIPTYQNVAKIVKDFSQSLGENIIPYFGSAAEELHRLLEQQHPGFNARAFVNWNKYGPFTNPSDKKRPGFFLGIIDSKAPNISEIYATMSHELSHLRIMCNDKTNKGILKYHNGDFWENYFLGNNTIVDFVRRRIPKNERQNFDKLWHITSDRVDYYSGLGLTYFNNAFVGDEEFKQLFQRRKEFEFSPNANLDQELKALIKDLAEVTDEAMSKVDWLEVGRLIVDIRVKKVPSNNNPLGTCRFNVFYHQDNQNQKLMDVFEKHGFSKPILNSSVWDRKLGDSDLGDAYEVRESWCGCELLGEKMNEELQNEQLEAQQAQPPK